MDTDLVNSSRLYLISFLSSGVDAISRVYEEANNVLKSEPILQSKGRNASSGSINDPGDPSNNAHTVDTFLASLNEVQEAYLRSHNSKARRWLNTFADRVTFYGNIFDVLVQHHPEYVSLAWGTFKLLFVVCKFILRATMHLHL